MSIASRINEMTEHLRNDWNSIDKLGLDITEENSNDNFDKNIQNIAPVLDRFYNQSSDKTDLAKNGIVGRTSQGGEPTPENPVEINNLSGDVEYKVRGKNLFDPSSPNSLQGNTTLTAITNGIRATATNGGNWKFNICNVGTTESLNGKTIRFKAKISNSSTNVGAYFVGYCDSNGNNRERISDVATSEQVASMTIDNTTKTNVFLCLMTQNSATSIATRTYTDFINPILTINNDDTTYEPYISESFPLSLKSRNLFDSNGKIIENFINNSGMTYTLDNGIYTLNGTNTQRYIYLRYNVELEPGSYIFTGCPKGGSFTGYSCIVRVGGEPLFDYGDGVSFTLTEKETVMVYPVRVGADSITVNNLQFKPMLEKANNLFDKDNANILDGAFINATAKQIGSNANAKCLFIEVEPNTPYIISKSKGNRFAIGTSSVLPKNGVQLSNILDDRTKTSFEITSSSDTKYLTIYFTISPDDDSLEDILSSIEVYKNVGSSPYEPYYDIELCNISDYKDRIYSQNGKFYLEKKTGKVVLDGSRNWTKSGNTNIDRFVLSGYVDYGDTNCFSNYFTNETYSDSNYNKSKIFLNTYSNTKRLIINFNTVGTTSLSNLKTWLSTHNTVVYYVLATPTTTKITQENYPTLYSQLLAIQEFLTKYKINKEFLLDYSSPEIEY